MRFRASGKAGAGVRPGGPAARGRATGRRPPGRRRETRGAGQHRVDAAIRLPADGAAVRAAAKDCRVPFDLSLAVMVLASPAVTPAGGSLGRSQSRRKIEMSPGVQSRDDTPVAASDMTGATRHHSRTPDRD
jgi:hypothetical protein